MIVKIINNKNKNNSNLDFMFDILIYHAWFVINGKFNGKQWGYNENIMGIKWNMDRTIHHRMGISNGNIIELAYDFLRKFRRDFLGISKRDDSRGIRLTLIGPIYGTNHGERTFGDRDTISPIGGFQMEQKSWDVDWINITTHIFVG